MCIFSYKLITLNRCTRNLIFITFQQGISVLKKEKHQQLYINFGLLLSIVNYSRHYPAVFAHPMRMCGGK